MNQNVICTLGPTPWNLSCFEFKFDDIPDFGKLNWDSEQCRDLAMSGCIKQKSQLGQSYSYIIRNVWYHQIWIQNNLGFMVLILMYRLTCSCMFGLIFWVARSRGGHVADGDLIGEHRIMRHSLELNHLVTKFTKASITIHFLPLP